MPDSGGGGCLATSWLKWLLFSSTIRNSSCAVVPISFFASSGFCWPGSEIWIESVPILRTSTSATPHLSIRLRITSIAWSTASSRKRETWVSFSA